MPNGMTLLHRADTRSDGLMRRRLKEKIHPSLVVESQSLHIFSFYAESEPIKANNISHS
jgi:hypothetical protein